MKITYIFHSCFLVETDSCYYLFDYFKGSLPALDPKKPILVLASHKHADHYQSCIFNLLQEMGMQEIYAVLSYDIPSRTIPESIPHIMLSPCKTYELPQGQTLTTYRSTDKGVAFLIQENDTLIYHAGDLNDWVWEEESESYNQKMTKSYRRQIDALSQDLNGRALTAAFVVLDPRQEKDYDRGILYFLDKISGDCIYPMHYWEKPQTITRFLNEHPQYQHRIMLTESIPESQNQN